MACIEKVDNVNKIYDEINRIHASADSYETNFYAGKERMEQWVQWGQLECARFERGLALLRSSKFSKQVYYFTVDDAGIQDMLLQLAKTEARLNVDFLGKVDEKRDVFRSAGFLPHIVLHRMTRICMDGIDGSMDFGEYAAIDDAKEICEILEQTMDVMSDQVPGVREIEGYINRKMAIVVKDDKTKEIISCILWTRKGAGMEWNYWALNPKYKGTTAGIRLLEAYLNRNGAVRRSTLFVRDRNPASAIYQRIGFQYDGLNDYVYCYRKEEV